MTSLSSQYKAHSYLFETPVNDKDTTQVLKFELTKYSSLPTRICTTKKEEVKKPGAMSSRCGVHYCPLRQSCCQEPAPTRGEMGQLLFRLTGPLYIGRDAPPDNTQIDKLPNQKQMQFRVTAPPLKVNLVNALPLFGSEHKKES